MSEATAAIKILPKHLDLARGISLATGLPIVRSIGVAIDGWALLPAKVRDRLVREAREEAVQSDRRRLSAVG